MPARLPAIRGAGGGGTRYRTRGLPHCHLHDVLDQRPASTRPDAVRSILSHSGGPIPRPPARPGATGAAEAPFSSRGTNAPARPVVLTAVMLAGSDGAPAPAGPCRGRCDTGSHRYRRGQTTARRCWPRCRPIYERSPAQGPTTRACTPASWTGTAHRPHMLNIGRASGSAPCPPPPRTAGPDAGRAEKMLAVAKAANRRIPIIWPRDPRIDVCRPRQRQRPRRCDRINAPHGAGRLPC